MKISSLEGIRGVSTPCIKDPLTRISHIHARGIESQSLALTDPDTVYYIILRSFASPILFDPCLRLSGIRFQSTSGQLTRNASFLFFFFLFVIITIIIVIFLFFFFSFGDDRPNEGFDGNEEKWGKNECRCYVRRVEWNSMLKEFDLKNPII